MRRFWLLAAMAAGGLIACERQAPPPSAPSVAPEVETVLERIVPIERLTRGARLYQEHCAQCHGPEAQGHPDWENPQLAAAPPLNGTGNEWKRRKSELVAVIQNGANRQGTPVMPGWKGRLSDEEIDDIITWFQALWPSDVYERWRKVNAGAAPKG